MVIKRFMNWILVMPTIGACAIILVCVAFSSWAPATFAVPKLRSLAHQIAANYDSIFPEISVGNGRLSTRERQPCLLYPLGWEDYQLVIDTRDIKLHDLMDSLKNVSQGIMLAADFIVVKYRVRTYVYHLPDLPDTVLNSSNIDGFVSVLLPKVKSGLMVLVILYVLVVKLLQAACLGLVTHLIGYRLLSVPLTYGESVNLAFVAMIPPVLLDCLLKSLVTEISGTLFIYFGVYIVILALCLIGVYTTRSQKMVIT